MTVQTPGSDAPRLDVEPGRVRALLDTEPAPGEHRVLVDRLWPRGVAKARLRYDRWDKDVAPTADLRRAFHGGDLDFAEFAARYRRELDASDAPARLLAAARDAAARTVVLLYAARDADENHAVVLAAHLRELDRGA